MRKSKPHGRKSKVKTDESATKRLTKKLKKNRTTPTTGNIQSSFHHDERKIHPRAKVGGFPIVAVGASAGGVECYTQLLRDLPPDTGMAFVLIQHLAPDHDSLLSSILRQATKMEVFVAETEMAVAPNTVYVIPPNTNLGIINGVLRLLPRLEKNHRPIDFFFRCLADEHARLAIGIVLSGADSDGSEGLRAIRAQGGLAFVQDPKTAQVDSMPRNAIAAGGTDKVLTIPAIAAELVRLSKHPLSLAKQQLVEESPENLVKILAFLRQRTGVDFTAYKKGTLTRRLRRRVLLHKVDSLENYIKLLREKPEEIEDLFRDLLINVTGFFRDAEVFETLREKILPKFLKKRKGEHPIRIWAAGCATGEEAYTLAIIFLEAMDALKIRVPLQIFASDLSLPAIEVAREAVYGPAIASDVSTERLRRHFIKVPEGYRVNPLIRESCIFAEHDITRDSPFSRMDMVSCRNLLIYLEQPQQKKVMARLAYALNPGGLLLLGTSETPVGSEAFETEEKTARIYRRTSILQRAQIDLPLAHISSKGLGARGPVGRQTDNLEQLEREVNRRLLEHFAPVGLVISANMQIIQFRGATGDYLEPAAGEASLNLFKMTRGGLDSELRVLLKKAEKTSKGVRKAGVIIRQGKTARKISVEILPILLNQDERFYLILFSEYEPPKNSEMPRKLSKKDKVSELFKMQEELESTREYLQSIIRDQDVTYEELQSANEEVVSSNEELQSTNEELETAKEEMQSTNEELTTVNDELTARNLQLTQLNDDLNNILGSVNIPIVMVGNDLCIRRFTPMAERNLHVIPSDVGRPITDIKLGAEIPKLQELIEDTIECVQTNEVQFQSHDGHQYQLRIRPYRTGENKIDGAVLVFVDLEGLAVKGSPASQNFIDSILQPVALLDKKFGIRHCNDEFAKLCGLSKDQLPHRSFFSVGHGQWSLPVFQALMSEVISKGSQIIDFEVDRLRISARPLHQDGSLSVMVVMDVKAR